MLWVLNGSLSTDARIIPDAVGIDPDRRSQAFKLIAGRCKQRFAHLLRPGAQLADAGSIAGAFATGTAPRRLKVEEIS